MRTRARILLDAVGLAVVLGLVIAVGHGCAVALVPNSAANASMSLNLAGWRSASQSAAAGGSNAVSQAPGVEGGGTLNATVPVAP